MAFKVAIASLDGKLVNQHFGRSESFRIYQVEGDGGYGLLEEREVKPPCGYGKHEEDALQATAQLLADCSVVLVSRIGPGAEKALASKGIRAFEIYDTIDKAITKLVRYFATLKLKEEAKSQSN